MHSLYATVAACCLALVAAQTRRTCSYHVVSQKKTVRHPLITSTDVGSVCPRKRYGDMNWQECNLCAASHSPCEGRFGACVGCCTTLHSTSVNASEWRIPQNHSCDAFKKYLIEENNITLELTEPKDEEDLDQQSVIITGEEVEDVKSEDGCFDGFCSTECDAQRKVLKKPAIPFKLMFDCSNCSLLGVPELLQFCCDEGLKFKESAAFENMKSNGSFEPFFWMNGCHSPRISPVDNPWQEYSFDHYVNYTEFTQDMADRGMLEYVEKNYCESANNLVDGAELKCERDMFKFLDVVNVTVPPLQSAEEMNAACNWDKLPTFVNADDRQPSSIENDPIEIAPIENDPLEGEKDAKDDSHDGTDAESSDESDDNSASRLVSFGVGSALIALLVM